jgi:hypothetical protein
LLDRETQKVLIEVLKPNRPLNQEALKSTFTVQCDEQSYLIPSLEMAVALRFAPMMNLPWSDSDKYLYAHDFILMVKVNPDLNLTTLAKFGELAYAGGGKEIVEKVECVRTGKKFTL